MSLTWGLAIATYQRADTLCQTLTYALQQSRPPIEVVICDSSPDWKSTRDRVANLVQSLAPGIRFWYDTAPVAQQTVQRNVTVRNSSADVLFMIDDDAFLAPNAAKELMQAYEASSELVAVGPGDIAEWRGFIDYPPLPAPPRPRGWKRLVRRIIAPNVWYRPIEYRQLNSEISGLPLRAGFIDGYRITVRRIIAQQSLFDENLVSNRHEDGDATYRFSQLGVCAILDRPLVHHAAAVNTKAAGERKGEMSRIGWILNLVYLNRKYFGSGLGLRAFAVCYWLRLLLIDLIHAVVRRDASRLRGTLHVFGPMRRLLSAPQADIGIALQRETRTAQQRLKS